MADAEWFEIHTERGTRLADDDGVIEFPNVETATDFAREQAGWRRENLTVMRFTRQEVRTFCPKVTIEEADVTRPA
jgi:hypothetical protein